MMSLLTWVFLESQIALGIVLGLTLFGLLVHWRRSLNPRPFVIGMVVAVILLFAQKSVVTQSEHAGLILDAIARDLLQSKPDAIERSLADPFQAGEMDRDGFLQVVKTQLRRVRIHQLSRGSLRLTQSETGAFQVQATFSARVDSADYGANVVPSTWQLDFVKTSEGWRIRRIEPISLGFSDVKWDFFGGR